MPQKLPPHHPKLAKLYNNLGLWLMKKGEHEAAVTRLRQSMDIKEKVYGSAHPQLATTMNNIGSAMIRSGNQADLVKVSKPRGSGLLGVTSTRA